MDIYKRKSRWKNALSLIGLVLVLVTIFYSNYLAQKLKNIEKDTVYLYAESVKNLSEMTDNSEKDFEIESLLLEKINYIPVILEDEKGDLQGMFFIEDSTITDQKYLESQVKKSINYDDPILNPGGGYATKIYYQHSRLYTLIEFFPLVQVILLSTFVLMGYFLFSTSRRAEQNRVWVGMSKETAHQLGTPVSAIMAWIEHLKLTAEDNPEQMEIINELNKDVKRLDLIADRFSKIGSIPTLERVNIYEELQECKQYMEKRASRNVKFSFPAIDSSPLYVKMNRHLFDWVVENLLRNALDAMGAKGSITSHVIVEGNYVSIDICDSGAGIPVSKFKTVFQPGFTTKKRGWGLGLTLAKRIVEVYHHGKIIVKSSTEGEGTCFNIKLPKSE